VTAVAERELTLGTTTQAAVAGTTIGVIAVKPDQADLEAIVGVFDPDRGEPGSHRVRPGDVFEVAGRRIAVTGIDPRGKGVVDVLVRWDEEAGDG
jgi:hypothetical protein